GLEVALAGSLTHVHLPMLGSLRPDIIGVRGVLCSAANRRSRIDPRAARAFIGAVHCLAVECLPS
ncbi:MAG: hypothetical protein HY000_37760, partial [Planctomycetes bacterium]|nr:hypothetical protein [Planctomycetota bacterium]